MPMGSLFREIVGANFDSGDSTRVLYEGGITAVIDGTINGDCAVEIESRVDKQIRGALIDLLCHSFPKKLLVLIPAHMNNPERTAIHCKEVLYRFKKPNEQVEIVLLQGSGDYPNPTEDKKLIENALKKLGCLKQKTISPKGI